MKEFHDYSLLNHNTFGIEAKAERFITYDSVDDLQQVITHLNNGLSDRPLLHIGGGSNLLFLSDYKGVILHSRIKDIEIHNEGNNIFLRVGAGMVWDDLVDYCVENGYYGLENLSLIPGEVGASAVQNIGAYGVEAKDVIQKVECVDLKTSESRIFATEECKYGYRSSIFKKELQGQYAVTYVWFKLSRIFEPHLDYGGIRNALLASGINEKEITAKQLRQTIIEIRQAKLPDPKDFGNAGSFFMNPIVEREVFEHIKQDYPNAPHYVIDEEHVKIPAGWLIEQCGWKGRSLGKAAVHDKQALVLINKGGAIGKDILELCNVVRNDVKNKFGIIIHPEVNFIGGEA